MKKTEMIDYDEVLRIAKQEQPKLVVAGASAYPRVIDFAKLADIAHEVGAMLMVDMAHIAGLVAAGLHPSPVPHADIVTTTTHKTLRGPRGGMIMCKEQYAKAIDKAVFPGTQGGPLMHIISGKAVALGEALKPEFREYQSRVISNAQVLAEELNNYGFHLVSGGTDNHLLLVNLTNKNITGKEAEARLDDANITCNKNSVPFETLSPFVTSGIRLGTPAITTRGFDADAVRKVAKAIDLTVTHNDIEGARALVAELTAQYPLYPELY